MSKFLTVLAWPVAIGSVVLLILRILAWWKHNMTHIGILLQSLDRIKGVRRTFPMKVPSILALLSISWLISRMF